MAERDEGLEGWGTGSSPYVGVTDAGGPPF